LVRLFRKKKILKDLRKKLVFLKKIIIKVNNLVSWSKCWRISEYSSYVGKV
jgi:hypothetical protein